MSASWEAVGDGQQVGGRTHFPSPHPVRLGASDLSFINTKGRAWLSNFESLRITSS